MLNEAEIAEHVAALTKRGMEIEQASPHLIALARSFLINQRRQTLALEAIAKSVASINAHQP